MAQAQTSNNIRKLREERHLTQADLAALISDDLSIATISRLEKGRVGLTRDWMKKIADALGVTEHDIIADEIRPLHFVPIIGYIAAGNWNEAVTHPQGWMPILSGLCGPNSFALKSVGDSMDLIIAEGGYIVVDPDRRQLIDGKSYAVKNGEGETTFKRYKASPPQLLPCSSNPLHEPIDLGAEPFTVIGRVVWAGTEL